MKNNFRLSAQLRTLVGTKHARRMRRLDNIIPGVVYGAGKSNQDIHLASKELNNMLADESSYSRILTLNVEGEAEQKVVLKQVHRHPSRPRILHIDLLRIDMNKKLTMEVPIHLINAEQAPGVKDGGVLSHHLTEVEIECLPANLPQFIELDIGQLELGESLHLSDLALPEGTELTVSLEEAENNQPVVSILKPHIPTAEELASEAAAPEAPVTEVEEGKEEAETKE